MLKFIFIFISVFFLQTTSISASTSANHLDCSPELHGCLRKILSLPEAEKLVQEIQKEGPIRIRASNHGISDQFGAFWDVDRRIINVNTYQRSEGEIIGSIIFELHNASVNSKLNHFDHLAETGRISRERYVEEIEYLEYVNSKRASAIATEGIKRGIFPRSAHLPTYRDFDEHFHYQKVGGHSAIIAKNYEMLSRSAFSNMRQTRGPNL